MFTTSRYAGPGTRRMARKLAEEAGEPFVARGKRTVAQLAALARKMGEGRVSILEERGKKPGKTAVVRVSETGKWEWV
jgi:rRNA maturation protein Rpf1